MSRPTTARHSKLFFCAYGDHGAPIDKRTEHRGVTVCAACKAHWEQNEAHLDSLDAANDIELDVHVPGEAFNEALAELVYSSKVLSLSYPAELETVSAVTVTLAQVERLRALMREQFFACHEAYTGRGLHLRAGTLVSAVSAGVIELREWAERQCRESVGVAS